MSLQITDSLVTVASTNLEKLVNFYTDLLSQQPRKYIPNVYAEFQLPGVKLGLFKPKPTHKGEFTNSTQSKMSLCLEVKNLENAIAHLIHLGYPPPGEITTASHGQEIYIYDTDGNRIILHQGS
jgi:catechol 2,3-dioxygenase-like lactoylglutathione lyase family enzyme